MTAKSFQILQDHLKGRLDPEYYDPKYESFERNLQDSKWPAIELRDIVLILEGISTKPRILKQKRIDSIALLHPNNIQEGGIETGSLEYIAPDISIISRRVVANENDILMRRVGFKPESVGIAAIVPNGFPFAILGPGIALLRGWDTEQLDPRFLLEFLSLDIYRIQLGRSLKGTRQLKVSLKNLGASKILIPPPYVQKRIIKVGLDARRRMAALSIRLSEFDLDSIVGEKLGYPRKKQHAPISFAIRVDQLRGRLDPEYYRGPSEEYNTLMEKHGQQLKDVIHFRTERIDPKATPDKKFRYVQIADIDAELGLITSHNELSGKDLPSRGRMILRSGDLIIPKPTPSLGKVALVTEEYDGAIGTNGFIIAKPKDVDSDYLYAILRAEIGQQSLKASTTGTIIPSLSRSNFAKVTVPIVEGTIDEIAEAAKAYRKELLSFRAEEKSIRQTAKLKIEKILLGDK